MRQAEIANYPTCSEPAVTAQPRPEVIGAAPMRDAAILLAVIAIAGAIATYYVGRYAGRWAEQDTAILSIATQAVLDEGTFAPQNDFYPYGYLYPVVSSLLVHITGVSPTAYVQILAPFLIIALAPPLYVLFREATGNAGAAALALLLMYLQPDFLFVVLRSSHEKFTLLLVITALFLLIRSDRVIASRGPFSVHVGLFYLITFTLVTTSILFGASFFSAAISAVLANLVMTRAVPACLPLRYGAGRLLLATAGASVSFVAFFALYPPAGIIASILGDAIGGLADFLSRVRGPANPYEYIGRWWISLPAYLAVSAASWLLVVGSLAVWLTWAWRWLIRKQTPPTHARFLLWLFYAAYAMQVAAAVAIDFTGFLGRNLQLRLFPYLAVTALPMTALAFIEWRGRQPLRRRRLAAIASAAVIAWFGVGSLYKAANEPYVSNNWIFYTAAEALALQWTDRAAHHASIWTGVNDRLRSAQIVQRMARTEHNKLDIAVPKPGTRHVLLSDVTLAQLQRMQFPLPDLSLQHRIYDNGAVQIFHLRQQTPYHR